MDIVFGDCVALGGNWSDLLLVDVATIYCWLYGMSYLSYTSITSAPEKFKSEAGQLPKCFHSDFNRKLMGGNALHCILANGPNIITAPARRQFSNVLAEHTWRTLTQMERAYITENQVGRKFWNFEIGHAEMMFNQVTGLLCLKITTPFDFFHNAKQNSKTWFELFSIGYFNHDTENTESRSKLKAHTMDGISVGRDDKSKSIILYNPIASSYYHLTDFCLDESRLPITNFPNSLRFDGSLTCGLLRNKTYPVHENFPPGTHVSIQHTDALT